MERRRIYLLSGKRRPVQVRPGLGLLDRQEEAPAGWCDRCGAEVYRPGRRCCRRCEGLHPGR